MIQYEESLAKMRQPRAASFSIANRLVKVEYLYT